MASQYHLDASVDIGSPAPNAIQGGSFTVSGTASCDLLKDDPEEPDIFVRHANEAITGVQIRLGSAGPFTATPTGSAATPWISWAFTASSVPNGPLTITADVFASQSPAAPGRASLSRAVIVDVMPPTLTITPPADVVRPAPPFIATITGTASDSPAGVGAVEWQFNNGGWHAATGTTSWSADVPLPGVGLYTVSFHAGDNLGNISTVQNVNVRVGDMRRH